MLRPTSVADVFCYQIKPPVVQPKALARCHPLAIARQLPNFKLPGQVPPVMLACRMSEALYTTRCNIHYLA